MDKLKQLIIDLLDISIDNKRITEYEPKKAQINQALIRVFTLYQLHDIIIVETDLGMGKGKQLYSSRIQSIDKEKYSITIQRKTILIEPFDVLGMCKFKYLDLVSKNDNTKTNGQVFEIILNKTDDTITKSYRITWLDYTTEIINESELKIYNPLTNYEIGDYITKTYTNKGGAVKTQLGFIKNKIDDSNYTVSWWIYENSEMKFKDLKQDITKDNCVKYKYNKNENVTVLKEGGAKNYTIMYFTSSSKSVKIEKGYQLYSGESKFESELDSLAIYKYIAYQDTTVATEQKQRVAFISNYDGTNLDLFTFYTHSKIVPVTKSLIYRIIGFHNIYLFIYDSRSNTPEVEIPNLKQNPILPSSPYPIGTILKIVIPVEFVYFNVKYLFGTHLITIKNYIKNERFDGYELLNYFIMTGTGPFPFYIPAEILSYLNPTIISTL